MTGAWIAIGLASIGWLMNIALAIDNWVHRQSYQGSEQGTRLAKIESEWDTFKGKQSEVANRWQGQCGAIELDVHEIKIQMARIEEHLKFIDRGQLDNTPRPRTR